MSNSTAAVCAATCACGGTAESTVDAGLAPSAIDPETLRPLLAELALRLGKDDFACGKLFADNEVLLRAALGDHFAWIAEAIRDFNFAAALDWLREAAAARGVAL